MRDDDVIVPEFWQSSLNSLPLGGEMMRSKDSENLDFANVKLSCTRPT